MSVGACNCCDSPTELDILGIFTVSTEVSCEGTLVDGIYTACTLPTQPDFPPFPTYYGEYTEELEEGQGLSNIAARFHSISPDTETEADGNRKSERRVKYKIGHHPPITCYLKVWIELAHAPAIGSPSVTTQTYEWSGTGNPCLNMAALYLSEAQIIYGAATTVDPPAANGTITLNIQKYSFVQGYEPDITDPLNRQPDGFPDPAWEASPP